MNYPKLQEHPLLFFADFGLPILCMTLILIQSNPAEIRIPILCYVHIQSTAHRPPSTEEMGFSPVHPVREHSLVDGGKSHSPRWTVDGGWGIVCEHSRWRV